ncbi:MAG: superinfection immunity protein [Kiritimatiellales bacterium]
MIFVYFLPSIYSRFKKDDKFAIILFLNVIFGATVIGWIVLFIWVIKRSVTGERNSTR